MGVLDTFRILKNFLIVQTRNVETNKFRADMSNSVCLVVYLGFISIVVEIFDNYKI